MNTASVERERPVDPVLRVLRLWMLWRLARVVLPLLVLIVLLGELAASAHRRPLISPPRDLAPITAAIHHYTTVVIHSARRDLTRTLESAAR